MNNIPPSTPIKGNKFQKLNNSSRAHSAYATKNSQSSTLVGTASNAGLITPQTVSRFKPNTVKQVSQQQTTKKKNFLQTPRTKSANQGFHSTNSRKILQTPQNNGEDIREKLLSDMFATPNIFNPTTPVLKLQFESESDVETEEESRLCKTPKDKIISFEQARMLHNDSSRKELSNKNRKLRRELDDDEEVYIRNKVVRNPFLSDEDDKKSGSSDERDAAVKRLSFK